MDLNKMDDKDLTVLALKQRIGELVADYEERVAELRVALTRAEQQMQNLGQNLMEYQMRDEQNKAPDTEEVEDGSVQ